MVKNCCVVITGPVSKWVKQWRRQRKRVRGRGCHMPKRRNVTAAQRARDLGVGKLRQASDRGEVAIYRPRYTALICPGSISFAGRRFGHVSALAHHYEVPRKIRKVLILYSIHPLKVHKLN